MTVVKWTVIEKERYAMSNTKPKRYWIRKGTGGWTYDIDDANDNPIVQLPESYYDAVSFIPAINGIEVIEASAYGALEARILELETMLTESLRLIDTNFDNSYASYVLDAAREVLAKEGKP